MRVIITATLLAVLSATSAPALEKSRINAAMQAANESQAIYTTLPEAFARMQRHMAEADKPVLKAACDYVNGAPYCSTDGLPANAGGALDLNKVDEIRVLLQQLEADALATAQPVNARPPIGRGVLTPNPEGPAVSCKVMDFTHEGRTYNDCLPSRSASQAERRAGILAAIDACHAELDRAEPPRTRANDLGSLMQALDACRDQLAGASGN